MVVVHLKHAGESVCLLQVSASTAVADLLQQAVFLHNGRIKLLHLCSELESLAEYGAAVPPDMVGLLESQVEELRLQDEWNEDQDHHPSGGYTTNKDPLGKRSGRRPTTQMQEVLIKTCAEVKALIATDLIRSNVPLSEQHIYDGMTMLRGAVTIVYPAGLPPHDVVQQHLDNTETIQPSTVIDPCMAQLWFAGKELQQDKKLKDYIGNNEKTKVVVSLGRRGHGAPGREPQLSAADQASFMAYCHQRKEAMKKLEEDNDDTYLDSKWSDPGELKRQFQGLENIHWKPH